MEKTHRTWRIGFVPLLLILISLVAPAAAQAAPAPALTVRAFLELDRPIEAGDYAWDDAGVAAGRTVIVIDLGDALLHVFRDGVEIGRSSILYGADQKPTPTGRFAILQKRKDHVSNLYHAPMPYMLRLTWGGISIHATDVDDEYATHGCIGVPMEFAALLFANARVGDRVVITQGQPDADDAL